MSRISDTISDTGLLLGTLICSQMIGCAGALEPGFTEANAYAGAIRSSDEAEGENQFEM